MARPAALPDGVFRFANSGIYFATGSVTFSFPSSWSMRIAVPVIGFVIEAIQKRVSDAIGFFEATSAKPVVSRCRILSLAITSVTAPAISFFVIISCIASPMPGSLGGSAKAKGPMSRTAGIARLGARVGEKGIKFEMRGLGEGNKFDLWVKNFGIGVNQKVGE